MYVGLILLLMLIVSTSGMFNNEEPREKYSVIIGYFENEMVEEFTLDQSSSLLTMTIKNEDGTTQTIEYTVPNQSLFVNDVEPLIEGYNETNPEEKMVYDYEPLTQLPWWVSILPSILIFGGLAILWYMMLRQTRGGGGNVMGFGKAKPRTADDSVKVTFKDVAGADEEKAELEEIVEFLKQPSKFSALGARIPKGVLLMGPPGTGKTLIAKAVAGEAGVPFFSISGSDFVEMFVGVGASRVRDLFDQAKKSAPSIIFIDEIDAVGRHRGAGLGGGHDEREQTLNQLLVEMDGFAANIGVIIIAATNRRDILDPALLRPGRFDRQIVVGYPDVKGREEILKVHTKNKPLAPDVELSVIAKTTAGFTGADLENIINEAALLAARADRKAITMIDVQDATIKVIAGPEKRSHVYTDKDKRLTAFHEAGHALCTYFMKNVDPVHQISIIPRGMAGGYTMSLPTEDKHYRTKKQMSEELVVLLGGRMAEKLVLDDISTGASNDLERVSKIARAMITRYGFSDKLGPVVYGQDQGEVFLGRDISQSKNYSDVVAHEIDEEVRLVIDVAYKKAEEILSTNMEKLHIVSNSLLEREKLEADEFNTLMEGGILPPLETETTEKALEAPQESGEEVSEEAVSENIDIVAAQENEQTAETEQDKTDN